MFLSQRLDAELNEIMSLKGVGTPSKLRIHTLTRICPTREIDITEGSNTIAKLAQTGREEEKTKNATIPAFTYLKDSYD